MKFSRELSRVLDKAAAIYYDSDEIGCMNLLLAMALAPQSFGGELLGKLGLTQAVAGSYCIPVELRSAISATAEKVIFDAEKEAESAGYDFICSHHLLKALICQNDVETRQLLIDYELTSSRVLPILDAMNAGGIGSEEKGVRVGRGMKNRQLENEILSALKGIKQ